MKFGPVPVADAEGAILAHSQDLGGRRLRKGRWLSAEDSAALAAAGLTHVTVARLEEGDVHEDEAARALSRALLGGDPAALGLRASEASTGRVNLFSDTLGVAQVDVEKINALNALDPMLTVATVPAWQCLGPGGMVATVKVISYAVADTSLARARALAAGALRMRPVQLRSALLIQTIVPGDDGARGHKAIFDRCAALGIACEKHIVPHDDAAIAAALDRAATGGDHDLILILTGSATSDIHDTAPQGLRRAGGTLVHYGMPVDPGNLLFVGDLRGKAVIGLPGCARSPARNGADWVLDRIACGVPVTGADIAAMGVGGLLKDIPERGRPRLHPETDTGADLAD